MGVLTAIGNAFKAVGTIFGWAKQKDAEENTPAMQQNAAATADQKVADQANKEVGAQDQQAIDKDLPP